MTSLAIILIATPLAIGLYAYIGYPALLWMVQHVRRDRSPQAPRVWPQISITVPAFNEEAQIRGTIESLLRIDYPEDRRQILVVSDASTDRTDEIVAEYASQGVQLLRVEERRGKGAAENAAAAHLTGEIVINTDASVRIAPDAVRPLIAQFSDPSVGLASGRDISVAAAQDAENVGESGYVGYEMWVRRLETRVGGIVGASGCFYAIRTHLHRQPLPEHVSRDFAAAIVAREHGYRSVSVDGATCLVPRTGSLRSEYRRKVRTMTRGMETLLYKRALLNPARYGIFSWMLFSHKVCRWLLPWAAPLGLIGLLLLAPQNGAAALALSLGLVIILMGLTGILLSDRIELPRVLSIPAFALASNVAAFHASIRTLQGKGNPLWEPTRREVFVEISSR